MISPLSAEATAILHQRLTMHPQFRTYSSAFSWAFELPLYLLTGSALHVACPEQRLGFCMAAEPSAGFCDRCPFRKFPAFEKLEPWVWSMKCATGLDVTLAPVRSGTLPYAWRVTGHHAAGGMGSPADLEEALQGAGYGPDDRTALREKFFQAPVIPRDRQELLNHFLELMGAMLGAEVNAILTAIPESDSCRTADLKRSLVERRTLSVDRVSPDVVGVFQQETGMDPAEFLQRSRIEGARRQIMASGGSEAEIRDAAEFRKLFQRFFGESPSEHFRRMRGVQDRLWNGITRNS